MITDEDELAMMRDLEQQTAIEKLTEALDNLVVYVCRVGGFMKHEDQMILLNAKNVLAKYKRAKL